MMGIKLADLIFVRGSGFVDEIIERVTHSPYSHVTGIVKPNELIEAQAFRRTGYQGLDYYSGRSDVFTCDELTDEQRQSIVKYVMDHVGEEYDYRLIGWELEHYILHLDLPYDEKNAHDCSQLWIDAYRSVGIDPLPGQRYGSPGDLALSHILHKVGSY